MVHAERQRRLQRLQRVVAAIGIARIIGLAHAADQVPAGRADSPSAAAKVKNSRLRPGTKVFGKPLCCERDRAVAGQRGVADLARARRDRSRWSSPSLVAPLRELAAQPLGDPARGSRARPGAAGRNRSRPSRPRRSARAPRPGRSSNPARRKTARAPVRVRNAIRLIPFAATDTSSAPVGSDQQAQRAASMSQQIAHREHARCRAMRSSTWVRSINGMIAQCSRQHRLL